jgi:hypothetical protein
VSRGSDSWQRAHAGKRRHRTWAGACLHVIKIWIRFRDLLHVYQCRWGDDRQPMATPHYHVGHVPGGAAAAPTAPADRPRKVSRPARQMIIGFNELQLSTLKSRAAGRAIPYQQYAAEIIHDALARPVPPAVERCPAHLEPAGDGRHCTACDGGVY